MVSEDRRRPISEAPRNGRTVAVGDPEVGELAMSWNPSRECPFTGKRGVWESPMGDYTWSPHKGCGPTYFVDLPDYVEIVRA